jgi:choline dehydrogenase
MRLLQLTTSFLVAASAPIALSQFTNGTDLNYEYIVVGSGAGGGPLACRLAMAGHKTLLIEAGNDQAGNVNISVPGYQAVVTQDPKLRWDIFVNHYQDQQRAMRDPKYTWETASFDYHVGPDPPEGATPRGILYPRAATLGGSVTHNALIWILPHASDWDNIATLTGDNSWAATNMQQYLAKVLEWQPTEPTDPTILLDDLQLAQHLLGGATTAGLGITPLNALTGLANALVNDPNGLLNPARDRTEGFFQIPLIMKGGSRLSIREHIRSTVQAGYPLDVRTDCFVTKITFDQSGNTPKATGVEFLDGEYLYRASPLSRSSGQGTPGSATATKEVIISGGTFNTVQLLKLSGIGPKDELNKFNISVVSDLPGVGTNMQDRYEVPVNVKHPNDFRILDGCHFDNKPHDECLTRWESNPDILAQRGPYATNGLAATMAIRSDYASTTDIDLYIFGGPINFVGYFPQWGDYAVQDHSYFSWYSLKAHTRNRAGTVQLQSADPLDQPLINFNYFDTGTTAGGADQLDLETIVQAINMSREALAEYDNYGILGGTEFVEERPGPYVQSEAELEQYVKDVAWGHHASCSCSIGADDDPNAVLDSKFRVRGVQNLRVVDASVFPSIPGIFVTSAIFMVSEKAADVILNG